MTPVGLLSIAFVQTFIVAIVCVNAWEEMGGKGSPWVCVQPICLCSFSTQNNELRRRYCALLFHRSDVPARRTFIEKYTFYNLNDANEKEISLLRLITLSQETKSSLLL